MKPSAMHRLAHQGTHATCSPGPWHAVPKITGDYDLDATIMHRKNKDMIARIGMYLRTPMGFSGAYSPRSSIRGYSGNHGDD
jgi:hypothetical protein